MGEPGWYNDAHDPALARWHDGERWTEHTIDKASWPGPDAPPPPVEPAPATWTPADLPPASSLPPPASSLPPPPASPQGATAPAAATSLTERYRAWPRWARIAAPVAIGFLAIGAIGSLAEEDEPDDAQVEASGAAAEDEAPSIADAAVDALEDLGADVSRSQMISLVRELCAADEPDAAQQLAAITAEPAEQVEVLGAAGDAAQASCPEVTTDRPGLLNSVLATSQNLTTSSSGTPILPAAPDVTTTVPRTAATAATRAPESTQPRATQPPATQPPVTQPPATQPPTTQPSGGTVHPGAFCSSVGATGVASAGTPMTCSTTSCEGAPYEQARWRRTSC